MWCTCLFYERITESLDIGKLGIPNASMSLELNTNQNRNYIFCSFVVLISKIIKISCQLRKKILDISHNTCLALINLITSNISIKSSSKLLPNSKANSNVNYYCANCLKKNISLYWIVLKTWTRPAITAQMLHEHNNNFRTKWVLALHIRDCSYWCIDQFPYF